MKETKKEQKMDKKKGVKEMKVESKEYKKMKPIKKGGKKC